ncbi:hypothetical protein Psi01_34960 [Planobispora siamensis]|uniref:Uncharacterized protein n=1 Tax=Planobispora siamensis TaxID=936338 RepID=A0A8J3WMH1_9ACTN|nr:hypothetical protein Psi01_34960 [Planobispora siamensis]
MGALQLAGQELQTDAGGLELFGQGGQLDAALQAFLLVHHEGDRDIGGAQARACSTARSSSGRRATRVETSSEEIRVTPAALRESICVSRDWRTVEARA